eukprot:GHVL01000809.1.p1 GENE.GHVL01000809.1~~GHVL01000809.1.p1  ORF type:complete len:545 (+),score=86.87 GHVL01000809.1:23-1657(+)
MPAVRGLIVQLFASSLIKPISFVFAAISVYMIMLLPEFAKPTTIEEHSFSASYSKSGLGSDFEIRHKNILFDLNNLNDSEEIFQYMKDYMDNNEFDYFRHDFDHFVAGTTIFTLLESRRGDSRDSIATVFSVDWTNQQDNEVVAMGMALLKSLKDVDWLSKDVYFIFVDKSKPYAAGTRAWLKSYLRDADKFPRRGLLRQAVIIEADHDPKRSHSSVLVDVESHNGYQPNQDLPNVFISEADAVNLNVETRPFWDSVNRMGTNRASSAHHSAFLEQAIPAFTAKLMYGDQHSWLPFAKAIEGCIRSQARLLQALHHSFNFYIYKGTQAHVSSGVFLIPLYLIFVPIAIAGMHCEAATNIYYLIKGSCMVLIVMTMSSLPLFIITTSERVVTFLNRISTSIINVSIFPIVPPCGDAFHSEKMMREASKFWIIFCIITTLISWILCYIISKYNNGNIKEWLILKYSMLVTLSCIIAPSVIYNWYNAIPIMLIGAVLMLSARPIQNIKNKKDILPLIINLSTLAITVALFAAPVIYIYIYIYIYIFI